jgi:hypothetical protein
MSSREPAMLVRREQAQLEPGCLDLGDRFVEPGMKARLPAKLLDRASAEQAVEGRRVALDQLQQGGGGGEFEARPGGEAVRGHVEAGMIPG